MTQRFKRGRRAPIHKVHGLRRGIALAKALDTLGTPPVQSDDYVSAVLKQASNGWGMYLNDQLGDCVCADSAHQIMLHTANAGSIVIPTDDDVEKLYEVVGGYNPKASLVDGQNPTDQGCDEGQMCQYLVSTGLSGQKVAGTGPISPSALDHIRWAVQLFGACRLGIIVDQQMEEAFSSHQPWETAADPNDSSAGGHDVPIVKYDATYAYVVTWGGLQPVAWSLLAQSAFLDEAHAEVWPDFVRAGGTAPNGFSVAQLIADLQPITI